MNRAAVVDGIVVRQSKAYPTYDHSYRSNVARVREFLESAAGNLQVAGRNGMHKYDNQDHAMLTGLMAARNVMEGSFDLWRVNSDAEYLEDAVESEAFEIATPPMAIDEDGDATTFWGACGLVRRELFFAAGGFDEHCYGIEDVE